MEQNATNKETITTIKKEIPFWNRPSTRVFILIGIILVAVWYFTEWAPKQECANEVTYQPAVESVPPIDGNFFSGRQGVSEYYSYNGEKFKTREEAVSHCARNK